MMTECTRQFSFYEAKAKRTVESKAKGVTFRRSPELRGFVVVMTLGALVVDTTVELSHLPGIIVLIKPPNAFCWSTLQPSFKPETMQSFNRAFSLQTKQSFKAVTKHSEV